MKGRPTVILHSFDRRRDGASFSFSGLAAEVTARSLDEVMPALRNVEEGVGRGLHAAGFISYEAAPGLGTSLPARPPGPLHLLWFGLFEKRSTVAPRDVRQPAATSPAGEWRSSLDPMNYAVAVDRIRDYIAAGDAYQVNFTLRRRFRYTGDPTPFYRSLCAAQTAPFSAFIDTGRFQILSASPELFFRLENGIITVRPMKGTAPRGRWWAEDEAAKQQLRDDPKERAENLMIVDLMRNDLGMIAKTGSVRVASLFDIETLPTVHQMTSTVTANLKTGNGIVEIFRALFPCGSVTGAPKKRAMEIIAELEDSPRGIYTGCIGYISPIRPTNPYEAVFSVAIRTAVIDGATGEGELGVGSGITWDSSPAAEYAECLAKGEFALKGRPRFRIVETMLYIGGEGCFLLDRHLKRIRRSAAYFGFTFRPAPVRKALEQRTTNLAGEQKVRLLLDRKGDFTITVEPIPPAPDETVAVAFAGQRVNSRDPFLYHKTDHRDLYREELAGRPDCVDVIFRNERGEVTEGANHTIVARINGALVTPTLACGLLPGVFREELLARGEITERVITADELAGSEEIWLINSVRKWRRAMICP
jgi:para-aminobenzoate synthetase/4-amino-4-deoxychorismate lyase